MTISFVGAGTRTSQSPAASISVAIPSGSVGDLLWLTVISSGTPTFPSGWTKYRGQFAYKIATATSESNAVVTATNAESGQCARFASTVGFSTDVIGPTNTQSFTSNPGITTTRDNSWAVVLGTASTNVAWGAVAGWTEDVDNGSATTDDRNLVAHKAIATSGTASGTFNPTAGAAYVLFMFEVREQLQSTVFASAEYQFGTHAARNRESRQFGSVYRKSLIVEPPPPADVLMGRRFYILP